MLGETEQHEDQGALVVRFGDPPGRTVHEGDLRQDEQRLRHNENPPSLHEVQDALTVRLGEVGGGELDVDVLLSHPRSAQLGHPVRSPRQDVLEGVPGQDPVQHVDRDALVKALLSGEVHLGLVDRLGPPRSADRNEQPARRRLEASLQHRRHGSTEERAVRVDGHDGRTGCGVVTGHQAPEPSKIIGVVHGTPKLEAYILSTLRSCVRNDFREWRRVFARAAHRYAR